VKLQVILSNSLFYTAV